VAQINFCPTQTGFRMHRNIDILTIFPQFLTENGPNYGEKVELRYRDQLRLDTSVLEGCLFLLSHIGTPSFP
jgi:hypothetical protein